MTFLWNLELKNHASETLNLLFKTISFIQDYPPETMYLAPQCFKSYIPSYILQTFFVILKYTVFD